MPGLTMKGNDEATSGNPKDLTISEVKSMLNYQASEIDVTPAGNISSNNVQSALIELDTEKQEKIQFQDQSVNLGSSGPTEIDFVGDGVTASRSGNKITVTVPGLSGTGQDDIQFQNEGVDLGTSGTVNELDFVGENFEATRSGNKVTVTHNGIRGLVNGIPVGVRPTINLIPGANINMGAVDDPINNKMDITVNVSGYRQTYVSGDAVIVASHPGIVFTRNTISVWTILIPGGVELYSIDIYSTAAQNPGANLTLNINASGTYNNGITTLRIPFITGLNLGAGSGSLPANYAPTTGATNLFPNVQNVGSGDIQLLINNFNNVSALGAGATLLKVLW